MARMARGEKRTDAPYDLRFYVHRAEEERRALAKLATPGAPVVIWGPWLSGKSWMLGYLLERIQEADASAGEQTTVIDVDLESLLPEPPTPDGLLERFAYHLSRAAGVGEERFEKLAEGSHGWSDKLLELMEDHILLPATRGRVVLVVEKADAVWGLGDVQGVFYQALRRWKERVAHKPSWSSLRLVFLLSTTPSLVFEDPEYADVIELRDLLPAQATELARMVGLEWDQEIIERLAYPWVGGNPYLLRVLMVCAGVEGASLDVLAGSHEAIERLYSEHLGELGRLLEREPGLKAAMLRVLEDPRATIDEDCFQRLRRAGLMKRSANGEHRIPYQIHESYLRRRWKARR
jgi:hypothetical protein